MLYAKSAQFWHCSQLESFQRVNNLYYALEYEIFRSIWFTLPACSNSE